MSTPSSTIVDPSEVPVRGWDEMLAGFRALGGSAENIRLGHGPRGRGLFAVDPAKPVLLNVPENLLFTVSDLEPAGDRIAIRGSANVGRPEREFFEAYENEFSWGGGGRARSAELIASLDAAAPELRELLKTGFAMAELLDGDPAERTNRHFFRSRALDWQDKTVLAPLVDLANYGEQGLQIRATPERGVQILGAGQEEVLLGYGPHDSFAIFRMHGIATPQWLAHSMPLRIKQEDVELRIERNTSVRFRRGDVFAPLSRWEGRNLTMSYLMIGNRMSPRLSRGIFLTLAREAGWPDPDETFDSILRANKKRFLDLLAALEPHEGSLILALRRMARFQLQAIAQCIGTRGI